MGSAFAIAITVAALDPAGVISLAVATDAAAAAQLPGLADEVRLRLPELEVFLAADHPGRPASYTLVVARPAALAASDHEASLPVGVWRLRLADRGGSALLERELEAGRPGHVVREIAVIVEGVVRLHRQRLEELLEEQLREQLRPHPWLQAGAGAGYLTVRRHLQPAARFATGVELQALVWPRLEAALLWSRPRARDPIGLRLQDVGLAALAELPVSRAPVAVAVAAGPGLHVVDARATVAGATARRRRTVHATGVLLVAASVAISGWLGFYVDARAEYVDKPAKYAWGEEVVWAGGPWRLGVDAGVRFRL